MSVRGIESANPGELDSFALSKADQLRPRQRCCCSLHEPKSLPPRLSLPIDYSFTADPNILQIGSGDEARAAVPFDGKVLKVLAHHELRALLEMQIDSIFERDRTAQKLARRNHYAPATRRRSGVYGLLNSLAVVGGVISLCARIDDVENLSRNCRLRNFNLARWGRAAVGRSERIDYGHERHNQ